MKQGNHPWYPQLHEAYLTHHYWALQLSFKRTGCNYPQAFAKIECTPHIFIQSLPTYEKLRRTFKASIKRHKTNAKPTLTI